jgi:membrane protease YdiL (CAAX protease family)
MDNPDLPGTQRVETLAPKPPEVWPTILITISAIPISLIASLLAILVGVGFTQGAGAFSSTAGFELTIIELSRTPAGFLLLLLPGQLVFLFAAYVPCFFSSTPLVKRLGLVGGSLPSWSYPILILATPAVGMVGQLLPPLIDDTPSDQLLQIIDLIQTPGPVLFLFILMSISVLPAVAEETLFRGFLLMGLRRRWPAIWGILLSSVLFSAAHLDLQHAVGVFPLALWLGILTWRSGSILPAMLVHMVNNLIGGISIRLMDKQVLEEMSPAWTPVSLALLACGTIALCGSIWILIRFGSRPENADNQKGWQVEGRSVP